MGLDAIVYKHRSKLPLDPERAGLRMEPPTGEWYSERDQLPEPIKSTGVEALHRRLGNVSLISSLHTELAGLLRADSVLLGSILYDGTHGGDILSFDRIGILKNEISTLRNNGSSLSREVSVFLDSLDALIEAAEDNHNPITFV
jgi:hypothetical protein